MASSLSTYKKHFAKRTKIRKNNSDNFTRSQRTRVRRDSGRGRPPTDIVRVEDFVMGVREVDRPMTPGEFKSQVTVLTCLDRFVRGVFDTGAHGWTKDTVNTIGPQRLAQRADIWDTLSDLCYGASVLVERRFIGKANICLERFLSGVETSFALQDPSFIALLWRICLQLRGVEHRWPQSQILHKFFERLKLLVRLHHGDSTHDLFQLAEALCNVRKEDFQETLRIGYLKSINVLADQVGDDHPTVLHMASVYYHYWRPDHDSVKYSLIQKLSSEWHTACDSGDETVIITALHNLTYAAQYVCDWPLVAFQEGSDLFKRTSSLEFHGPWDSTARALTYSAKLVSAFYQQYREYDWCQWHMRTAINKLETGSSDHKIRAILLSSTLEKWQKRWGRHQEAESEQARRVRLYQEIDGPEVCLRCIQRNTLCQRCKRKLGIHKRNQKKKAKSVDLPMRSHPGTSSSSDQQVPESTSGISQSSESTPISLSGSYSAARDTSKESTIDSIMDSFHGWQ